jgi:hypothetical protein
MSDSVKLYIVLRDLGIFGVHYLTPTGDKWTTILLEANFFTKKTLAYERLDTISPKDTLMKVREVSLVVD